MRKAAGRPATTLTQRERDVLALLVRGIGDKQIAQELGVSYRTVRTHLERATARHGVSGRVALAVLFLTALGEAETRTSASQRSAGSRF